MEDRAEFNNQQFELQLELEDLSVEQLGEHGATFRQRADHFGASHEERLDVALRVFLALHRTPGLDLFEADERFAAWCAGYGMPADEWDDFVKTLQRPKPGRKTKGGS